MNIRDALFFMLWYNNDMRNYAEVIVDIANSNVDKVFDYIVPEDIMVSRGDRVVVPFSGRVLEGIVIDIKENTDCPEDKLKAILRKMDPEPLITEEQLKLAKYIKYEYRTTFAFALRFMFPAHMRGERVKAKTDRMVRLKDGADIEDEIRLCFTKNGKLKAPKRYAFLNAVKNGELEASKWDSSVISKLIEKGVVEETFNKVYRTPYKGRIIENEIIPKLTDAQQHAVDTITNRISQNKKKTILLHGVTGSGKTEVYIRAVKNAIDMGKTAIILVPEISLTPQLYSRFYARFGNSIAVFHSGLSAGERYDEYMRVKNGEAKIVMGARSAVFMPLENIGLIIIDEEHEESYKADNHPPYHAAEIARIRSDINNCVLVLASATPRIESYMKAEYGIYELLELPERVRGLMLPDIKVVDMRNEIMNGNKSVISGALYSAIKDTLAKKEQIMLFLNRRGYAASVQCAACGAVEMCTHCDIPLKYHRSKGMLVCHYCGRTFKYTKECKTCGEPFVRQIGIGTEKVEKEIKELFPEARVLRMDFDTTREKDAHERIYTAFKNGEADILIGTQMIARGLDFDNVTLAAVISADTMLTYGDFRAEERTFSMIEQVGGRAGRKKPGLVIVQTYNPSHYAVRYAALHDYYGMYKAETAHRQKTGKPPFSKVFRMLFIHDSDKKAEEAMEEAKNDILPLIERYNSDILLFAAKPAPIVRLDGKSRYHIVIKVIANKRTKQIKSALCDIWEKHNGRGVMVSFDTDPNDVN